jgi:hypothetical protein
MGVPYNSEDHHLIQEQRYVHPIRKIDYVPVMNWFIKRVGFAIQEIE